MGEIELVNTTLWVETGIQSQAIKVKPVKNAVKPGVGLVWIRQYPLYREGKRGLRPVFERLIQEGRLEEWNSTYNMPVVTVPKGEGKKNVERD